MLYENPSNTLTKEEMSLRCCDSSLDDLNPSQIGDEILGLRASKYIEQTGVPPKVLWKITPEGIVYVRKHFIKPIKDLIQRPDFDKILENMPAQNKQYISNLKELSKTDHSNEKVNGRIVSYGIGNIAGLSNLITTIINLVSKLSSGS